MKREEREMSAAPNRGTPYSSVLRYFGKKEFKKLLAEKLGTFITKNYSAQRAKQLLTAATDKRIEFVDKEVFFENKFFCNDDIGVYAYENNKRDFAGFVSTYIAHMKRKEARGESYIDLTSLLIFCTYYKAKKLVDRYELDMALAGLVGATYYSTKILGKSPYYLSILPADIAEELAEQIGLGKRVIGYKEVLMSFIERLLKTVENNKTYEFPEIEILTPLKENIRRNQIGRLSAILGVREEEVARYTREIPSLTEESPEFTEVLKQLTSKRERKVNMEAVIRDLKELEEDPVFMTTPNVYDECLKSYVVMGEGNVLTADAVKKLGIEYKFVNKEQYKRGRFNSFGIINIDCSDLRTIKEITPYLYYAADFHSLAYKLSKHPTNTDISTTSPHFMINLLNVKDIKISFIEEIKEKERGMSSKYRRPFAINIIYNREAACAKGGKQYSDNIRVISDIHADVNADYKYLFNFGNDFIINCGDIAGDCMTEIDWIRTFMKAGVCVAGNHLGYNSGSPELDGPQNQERIGSSIHPFNTKNGQTLYISKHFSRTCPIKYLSNGIYEYRGMVIIGTTLYTDFELFGEDRADACENAAAHMMNDFKYCKMYESRYKNGKKTYEKVKPFTTREHKKLFKVCVGYIRNRIAQMRRKKDNRPVVIITHHAPTIHSIADKYKNDPLSAAFASDLRWLIEAYPEIRLWCHGHTHERGVDYLYKQCRVVAEPFGYYMENGNQFIYDEIKGYGKRIPIKDVVSKKDWREILTKEIDKDEVKVYED